MAAPTYDELLALVDSLRVTVARLEAANARLQAELDVARRAGKRQAAPFRKGPPEPDPKTPGRKSGDAHGRHGHRPAPPPDQIQECYDAPLPASCPHCRGALAEANVVPQYQTEIPRRPVVRRFAVHVGHCRQCGARVQGRHDLQTSDALGAAASQLGPDAQAAAVHLNKVAGLSHGKVAAVFAALFGIDLTRGASAQINLRAAQRLAPAYAEVVAATQSAERLTVDETGWHVGGWPAWLHAWVGGRATCYAIDPKRSAEVLVGVLGRDWEGILVHDGFASYDRFADALHQQCCAHVLRRARDLLAAATRGAVRFPRAVIDLFGGAVHLRNQFHRGLAALDDLTAARDAFEDRLLALVNRSSAVPAYATFADHLRRHFESWFTFLTDPSVPATNWEAEQAIRPAVVNRKVWGGNRTWAGAYAQGVLLSVLETCRRQARSALAFVSRTLRCFGNPALPTPMLISTR
jgi:transposase